MTSPTLFVTGASGHLGRRVLELLVAAKYDGKIIAGTRSPAKIADLEGVEARTADFDDAASLDAAFKGVDKLLLISTDAIGRRKPQHLAAIDAAKRAGVKHIIYTSMPNPETSDVSFAPDHLATEQAVIASGAGYTILRNGWYAENLIGAIGPALASGKWYSASGDGTNAYVPREDCAQAAAAALLSSDTGSHIYTITGTELLSVAQLAGFATALTGKPIEVVNVDDAAYAAGLAHAGLPEAIIPMIGSFEINTRNGGFAIKTDDVEKLTGRKPQAIRAFLEANKAAFA